MSAPAPDPDFDTFVNEGCPTAFRRLVERHLPSVRAAARRVLGGRLDSADDVAQQVFFYLARKGRSLPTTIVLGAWLHRQAVRLALNEVRAATRRTKREQRVVEMRTIENQTAETEPAWVEVMPHVDQAILELPDGDQSALALRFGEQCKVHEVADKLGLSTAAAEKRISRALEKLRGRLVRRGVVPSALALGTFLSQGTVEAHSPTLAVTFAQNASAVIGAGGAPLISQLVAMSAAKSLAVGLVAGFIFGGTLVAWSNSRLGSLSGEKTTQPSDAGVSRAAVALPRKAKGGRWKVPAPAGTAEEIFVQVQHLLAQPDNEIARQQMRGLLAAMPADQFNTLLGLVGVKLEKWWELERVLPELARAWAAKDPVAAIAGVRGVEGIDELRQLKTVVEVFGVWHVADPTAAQTWLVENQDGFLYSDPVMAMVTIVGKGLAEKSEDELIYWAAALEGDGVKGAALAALWTEFTDDHFSAEHGEQLERLIDRFGTIEDRELSQFALRRLFRSWAENRYPELDNWLKSQSPGREAYEAALASVQVGDMMRNDGFSRSGGGLSSGQRMANAERALMLAGDRPESEVVAEIVGGMEEVPRNMRDWALPRLAGPERDKTIIQAANAAMETGMIGDYPAPRNALDWVVHHSDPVKRKELVGYFYYRWLLESSRYEGAEEFPEASGWSDELKAVLRRVAAENE